MVKLQPQILLINVLWFGFVKCHKPCDLSDSPCLTRASKSIFKSIVPGIKGLTKPLDPLYQDMFTAEIPNLKYELTDASLTGMKNCEVTLLAINMTAFTYVYMLECPQLVIKSNYANKGTVNTVNIESEGSLIISTGETNIALKGKYGQSYDENDKKLRIFMSSHDIETINKGPITFDISNLRKGDETQANLLKEYHNNNIEATEQLIQPILNGFLNAFATEANTFLKANPVDSLIIDE